MKVFHSGRYPPTVGEFMARLLDLTPSSNLSQHASPLDVGVAAHDNAAAKAWSGASDLLAALRPHCGHTAYRDATRPHRAVLALLRPQQRAYLSVEQRKHCDQVSGFRMMALPNTIFRCNPVLDAVADVVRALMRTVARLHVRVVRLLWLDGESCELLMMLASDRSLRDKFSLAIDDPDYLYHEQQQRLADARGAMDAENSRRWLLCRAVGKLAANDRGQLIAALEPGQPVPRRKKLSTGSQLVAGSILASNVAVAHGAMRHAMACYAFSTALIFAERLTRMEGVELPLMEEATLAAGVAAHNLAPRDSRHSTLAAEYFAQLASRSEDMALRSHGCYRLSLHEAVHRRRLSQALVLSAEAVRHAQSDSIAPGRAPFYRAWAHRGQAYVLLRLGKVREAVASCERALSALAHNIPRHPAVPRFAIDETRAYLALMLSRLKSVESG